MTTTETGETYMHKIHFVYIYYICLLVIITEVARRERERERERVFGHLWRAEHVSQITY